MASIRQKTWWIPGQFWKKNKKKSLSCRESKTGYLVTNQYLYRAILAFKFKEVLVHANSIYDDALIFATCRTVVVLVQRHVTLNIYIKCKTKRSKLRI